MAQFNNDDVVIERIVILPQTQESPASKFLLVHKQLQREFPLTPISRWYIHFPAISIFGWVLSWELARHAGVPGLHEPYYDTKDKALEQIRTALKFHSRTKIKPNKSLQYEKLA